MVQNRTSFPRGTNFDPGGISSNAEITRPGRTIGARTKFTFNNRFFDEWGKDPQVRARFEELRAEMEAEARRRVPKGQTGRLAASIQSRLVYNAGKDILRVELEAGGRGARYWAFVEYGTGRRGSTSRQPEPGLPNEYRHGQRQGQRAQPFLRPAILAVRRKAARGRPK